MLVSSSAILENICASLKLKQSRRNNSPRTNENTILAYFLGISLDEWDNMFIVKLILASMHLFLGLVAIVYLLTTKPTKGEAEYDCTELP